MKKIIIGIIIGVIMLGTVGVLASTIISSTNVICITIFLSSVLSCKESEK